MSSCATSTKAGIQYCVLNQFQLWIPVLTGMTKVVIFIISDKFPRRGELVRPFILMISPIYSFPYKFNKNKPFRGPHNCGGRANLLPHLSLRGV